MYRPATTLPDAQTTGSLARERQRPSRGLTVSSHETDHSRRRGSALLVLALAATGLAHGAAPPPKQTAPAASSLGVLRDSLIEAERAFSRAAGERGIQASFLEFLADDAVIFRPGPVNGKVWLRDHPPDPGLLQWAPAHVEIASAGDLGLSTGPWSYAPAGGGEAVAFGQFASVWRRGPDGRWNVVLDHGISHPRTNDAKGNDVARPQRPEAAGPGGELETLLAADRAFDAKLTGASAAAAYRSAATHTEIRLLRSDREPALGRDAAALAVGGDEKLLWEATFAQVSGSGDLGYTHGTARPASDPTAAPRYYARVWRREGTSAWQIILDIAPNPPTQPRPPTPPTPAVAPAPPAGSPTSTPPQS
jgi:ketosteroid isomerase-like protein